MSNKEELMTFLIEHDDEAMAIVRQLRNKGYNAEQVSQAMKRLPLVPRPIFPVPKSEPNLPPSTSHATK
jgi:hypothetical protein